MSKRKTVQTKALEKRAAQNTRVIGGTEIMSDFEFIMRLVVYGCESGGDGTINVGGLMEDDLSIYSSEQAQIMINFQRQVKIEKGIEDTKNLN